MRSNRAMWVKCMIFGALETPLTTPKKITFLRREQGQREQGHQGPALQPQMRYPLLPPTTCSTTPPPSERDLTLLCIANVQPDPSFSGTAGEDQVTNDIPSAREQLLSDVIEVSAWLLPTCSEFLTIAVIESRGSGSCRPQLDADKDCEKSVF